jgi:dephospho-CoA kinase
MTYTVALTGGIGSGKSLAANYFKQLGATIIDADDIARDIVQQDQPAYRAVVATFGQAILDSQANIDRATLRKIIFDNPAQKKRLESILHPIIRETITQQATACKTPYVLLVIPLLIESAHYDFVNRVVVVDCDETQQRKRACERDELGEKAIGQVIEQQASRGERLAAADDVIDNSGTIEKLEAQINTLHQQYLKLASRGQ